MGPKRCADGWIRLGLPLALMPGRLLVVDQPQRQRSLSRLQGFRF